jgi:tripartite-type tricarboxylate transporter receptor subunit TctC
VAVAPGGPTDNLARMIGQKLTQAWGQSVVIENKPGAGQVIGTGVVAKAAPDGYTLLMTTNTLAVNPWLFKNLPYDAQKDFVPITQVASSNLVLIVHPSVPVTTLQELLDYAKKYPGKLNYGSSGPSSSLRLAVELIKSMAHVDMVHVPFHGAGPLMTAIMGNVVQVAVVDVPTAKPHIKSGMVRGIAVTNNHREPSLPNLPTMSESGLPGYSAESWFGLIAPKGVPKPIVDQIQAEVAKILRMPDVVSSLTGQGEEPVGSSPKAFAEFVDRELAKWRKVVEDEKISVQ